MASPFSCVCMLVAIRHHVCIQGKSFDSNYDAHGGFAPVAAASPVAIVAYYLYTTVQIYSHTIIVKNLESATTCKNRNWFFSVKSRNGSVKSVKYISFVSNFRFLAIIKETSQCAPAPNGGRAGAKGVILSIKGGFFQSDSKKATLNLSSSPRVFYMGRP